jgi:hypothetical protein
MKRTVMALALVGIAGFAGGQESRGHASSEGRRWVKGSESPVFDPRGVIARADRDGSVVVVFATGEVALETGGESWSGSASSTAVAEIVRRASEAKARGASLGFDELLDLVRCPRYVRIGGSDRGTFSLLWQSRHQEPDGSWSPDDFGWHCDPDEGTGCSGAGRAEFRIPGTALLLLGFLDAGWVDRASVSSVPDAALDYLLREERRAADAAASPMAAACSALALARAATILDERELRDPGSASRLAGDWKDLRAIAGAAVRRVAAAQDPTGGWGEGASDAHRISIGIWSLLALKAGERIHASDPSAFRRGAAWIADAVESLSGASRFPPCDASALARGRAARACARAIAGAPIGAVAGDVQWLAFAAARKDPAVRDAETVFFATLAARKAGIALSREWRSAAKDLLHTQVSDGCASGSWDVESVWSAVGGRVASTAIMTLALELHYDYPLACWVD